MGRIRCDHLGQGSFNNTTTAPHIWHRGACTKGLRTKMFVCSQKNAKLIDRLVLTSEICSFLQILRVHDGPVSAMVTITVTH
jgi:hypothetical protein